MKKFYNLKARNRQLELVTSDHMTFFLFLLTDSDDRDC